jgi:hypothetical protein
VTAPLNRLPDPQPADLPSPKPATPAPAAPPRKSERPIQVVTITASVVVSLLAAFVSYRHAYELARRNGEDAYSAWAIPLTVDGLVLAASMVVLRASLQRQKAPVLAWTALIAGVWATLFANVMHGVQQHTGSTWIGAVVSAWPAVSLVVTFEMLIRVFKPEAQHTAQQGRPAQAAQPPNRPAQAAQAARAAQPRARVTIVPDQPSPPPPAEARRVERLEPAVPDLAQAQVQHNQRYADGLALYLASVSQADLGQRDAPLNQSELAKALGMTNRKLAARIIKDAVSKDTGSA